MRSVLSVSLPDRLVEKLKSLARETGRNKSDIIRESLSLYIWETRLKRLKKQFKPLAKKAGLVTEDDVFKQIS